MKRKKKTKKLKTFVLRLASGSLIKACPKCGNSNVVRLNDGEPICSICDPKLYKKTWMDFIEELSKLPIEKLIKFTRETTKSLKELKKEYRKKEREIRNLRYIG